MGLAVEREEDHESVQNVAQEEEENEGGAPANVVNQVVAQQPCISGYEERFGPANFQNEEQRLIYLTFMKDLSNQVPEGLISEQGKIWLAEMRLQAEAAFRNQLRDSVKRAATSASTSMPLRSVPSLRATLQDEEILAGRERLPDLNPRVTFDIPSNEVCLKPEVESEVQEIRRKRLKSIIDQPNENSSSYSGWRRANPNVLTRNWYLRQARDILSAEERLESTEEEQIARVIELTDGLRDQDTSYAARGGAAVVGEAAVEPGIRMMKRRSDQHHLIPHHLPLRMFVLFRVLGLWAVV